MRSAETMDVSFTKISDDVLAPTWRAQSKENESFRDNSLFWWGLGGFWLLCVYVIIKNGIELAGIGIVTSFVLFLGILLYFLGKIPQKWIELNRKNGFISIWTSRKKRKLIGRWHIEQVDIKMNCRWISSGPKGQTSEHRYLIELFDKNPAMKNTSFWKFDNHPQRTGVPFFVLFDLFGDPHSFTEESDFALASAITHRIEKFLRDFMAGRPVPLSSTSTYTFSMPD
jgi:hypothetical protein